MATITFQLENVSAPIDAATEVDIYEDVGNNGGANSTTVAGGYTVSYDNEDTIILSDGVTTYESDDVFDGGTGNAYQILVRSNNFDPELTGSQTWDLTLVDVGGDRAATMDVSEVSVTSPEPTVFGGDLIQTPKSTVSVTSPEPNVSGAGASTINAPVSDVSTTSPEPRVTFGEQLIQPDADTVSVTSPSPGLEFNTPGTLWRLQRNGDTFETDLYGAEVVDTANPFGNYAIAKIEDVEGNKFGQYPRGTRVDFEVLGEDDTSFTRRFSGYVVERRELNQQGADALEIEAYSFDQFLRRDTVSTDLSGMTISDALESIVTNDTPVSWVAGNVEVSDDQTLTQSYRGERVENAIQSIRAKSAFEDFGVNADLDFFFEPQGTTSAPRDISDSQWFNYDIPEEGKRTVNQVTCWYDDGNKSVTVDDGADKQELQDSLGTNDPITFGEEISRPDITNIDDARAEAEKTLNDKDTTLTGTVTTYGLIDASPGDVISITITDRGIDDDYQIAEIKYDWGRAETTLTIVEKRGDQDDLLVNLSDDVKRVEMQPVDRDATENRITNTQVNGIITVGGDVGGTGYDTFRYTNSGRNKVRDGWADNGNLDVTEIAVGNDSTKPTRTDSSLGNELERVSVSENLPDSDTVEYSGSFSTTDISEVGLFTSDGGLIARAIVDGSFTSPVTATLSLSVSDDSSLERGVLTDTGQTTVRDIIADNSPSLPSQYAYGTDGTTPDVTDTALGSQVDSVDIDELLVQDASQNDDWDGIISPSDTDPVVVSNDQLQLAQTLWAIEGEDFAGTGSTTNISDFSGGQGVALQNSGGYAEWTFTTEHDIDADQFQLATRMRSSGTDPPDREWYLDGQSLGESIFSQTQILWTDLVDSAILSGPTGTIEAGEHTLRVKATTTGSDEWQIDLVAPYDKGDRFSGFSYDFDNTNGGSGGYLDGPELYPSEFQFAFDTANTRRTLQNATANQDWTDTSNNQYIELSNDSGSNWIRTNNSETASANFASAETGVDVRVGFSRYGSRTSATPTSGFNGQAINSHRLFADVDAINPDDVGACIVEGVFAPGVLSGNTIQEAGQLDSSNNLLTHCTFAPFDVGNNMRVISSENVAFNNPS